MTLTESQSKAVFHKEGNILINAGAGSGKALTNTSKIQTTNGEKNIGDAVVGEKIFSPSGKLTTIIGVFPQGKKKVYEVHFSDGSVIECSDDHLWTIQTSSMRDKKKGWKTVSLREIINTIPLIKKYGKYDKHNVYVPITKPIAYKKNKLPISPYLIGVIIGCGGFNSRSNIRFSNDEQDVLEKVKSHLGAIGYQINKIPGDNCDYSILCSNESGKVIGTDKTLHKILTDIGIKYKNSHKKFIPLKYKTSSIEDRLSLLMGLIDTDGYFRDNFYEYSTTSKALAEDICFIAESLGMTACLSNKSTSYEYENIKKRDRISYCIVIKTGNEIVRAHSSEKHELKYKSGQSSAIRSIRSIIETNKYEEMTCIKVDDPSSLFLTDHFIATHNTTAYTARIANLLANEHVDPTTILAMTFTNEAADNMRAKLTNLVGKVKTGSIEITTFHSFAYKTLKNRYAHIYGDKKIIQQWWKFSKLYDLIALGGVKNPIGLDLIDKDGKPINAGDLSQFISYQKANMIKPGSAVLIDEKVNYINHIQRGKLQDAYDTYCDLVKHARVLEFDDMLMDFYYYLSEDENLLNDIKEKYNYVMVDEMQDTNSVNMEILKLITDNNLYAVGDFRQGIYGFINANIDNILSFQDSFPDVSLVEFRENFRSTKTIVGFCNKIIDVSPVEDYKQFKNQKAARTETGSPISMTYYQNEATETKEVVEEISALIDENCDSTLSDYAIICRTNAQLGMFESMFADLGIPVDVSSSKSYFDRKEVADIIAYAQHAVDSSDDMSLRKIINAPNRFVSKQTINDLDKYSFEHGVTLEVALMQMDSGRSHRSLANLVHCFEDLREEVDINASKFLRMVYNAIGYRAHLEKKATSHTELMIREEAVDKLFDIAKKSPTIEAFLTHVSIIKSNNNSKGKDAIRLLTVHASKGLEFDYVFAPGVTSANFPHPMNVDYEEERRLFYVVCSRAKNYLSISSHVFQGMKQESIAVSPFLVDTIGKKISAVRKTVLRGSKSKSITIDYESLCDY